MMKEEDDTRSLIGPPPPMVKPDSCTKSAAVLRFVMGRLLVKTTAKE